MANSLAASMIFARPRKMLVCIRWSMTAGNCASECLALLEITIQREKSRHSMPHSPRSRLYCGSVCSCTKIRKFWLFPSERKHSQHLTWIFFSLKINKCWRQRAQSTDAPVNNYGNDMRLKRDTSLKHPVNAHSKAKCWGNISVLFSSRCSLSFLGC